MSLCDSIQIHYINYSSRTGEQSNGLYEITDMQLSPNDENIIIFSWLISQNATRYAGALNFLVRFVCTDPDTSEAVYIWNTAIYSGISISSGILNTEEIIEQYPDVLEQWRSEIDAVKKQVDEIEPLIIDDYTIKQNADGAIYVNTATEVSEDNTLPITAAAVHTEIGNIDALLGTI